VEGKRVRKASLCAVYTQMRNEKFPDEVMGTEAVKNLSWHVEGRISVHSNYSVYIRNILHECNCHFFTVISDRNWGGEQGKVYSRNR